jgi:hypothetical protein
LGGYGGEGHGKILLDDSFTDDVYLLRYWKTGNNFITSTAPKALLLKNTP